MSVSETSFIITPRLSRKRAKFGITPPDSPSSPSSFRNENGFYTSNIASSPRLVSSSSDGGIDGYFKSFEDTRYPEVFTISTGDAGSPDSTLQRNGRRQYSPTSVRVSNTPEDKYKWTENDTTDSPPEKKSRRRHVLCIIALVVLFLGVCAGLAVILAYKVFKVGEAQEIQTTIRPDFITLEGSLDLIETWHPDLYDPKSPLYILTARKFKSEMDTIMKNSSISDAYIGTRVSKFSPGSINVLFHVDLDEKQYKQLDKLPEKRAAIVADQILKRAPYSTLNIKTGTLKIHEYPDKRTTVTTRASTTTKETTSSLTSPTLSSSTIISSSPSAPSTQSSTFSSSSSAKPTTSSTTSSFSTLYSTNSTVVSASTSSSSSTSSLATSTSSPASSSSVSPSSVLPHTSTSSSYSPTNKTTSFSTSSSTPSYTTTESATSSSTSSTTTTTLPTTTSTSTTPSATAAPLCFKVNYTVCASRGFTLTNYPNLLDHSTETEAISAFEDAAKAVFNQLCQEEALYYLCSLYFPKCNVTNGDQTYACGKLCNDAMSSCGDFFANPYSCDSFLDSDCVDMPVIVTTTTPAPICQLTRLQACIDLGFNVTAFPNLFDEDNQTAAIETFELYMKNDAIQCGGDALFFVCSVQFPKCEDNKQKKPCRRVCQDVVDTCLALDYFDCQEYDEFDCVAPAKPTKVCQRGEFSCHGVYKCIPGDQYCNGNIDCADWSDEMDCKCNEYEFQCDMGMCIKSFQRCDGVEQCPDRSDERGCNNCTHGQVRCPAPDGKCIMSEWLCDGRAECDTGWDERNCNFCATSQFTCADRSCVSLSSICDFNHDCPDGYDEWNCVKEEQGILQIPHRKYWLPICADSWSDSFGPYACDDLLGQGEFIQTNRISSNLHTYANLSINGDLSSVLGSFILGDCASKKVISVQCKPKGCGKRLVEAHRNFIVNGFNAKPGSWPWHVALSLEDQYFCGGTLIDQNFVITAAHCVEKYTSDFEHMIVTLGANNRVKSESTQVRRNVQAITSHEDHDYFKKNDIALLQLSAPVTYTDYIQPICLPSAEEELPLYSTCFTVGWGHMSWNGRYSEVLQELKMTLWDIKKCNSSMAWNGQVYSTFMCAGYYSGVRSVCKGDSGGPLVCMDKQNTWKLFGINSYVANFCNMTARPNIFTNVRNFIGWIGDKTECQFKCDNNKCLYSIEQICNRVDDCGDNSDEIRECNRTVSCDFDDKFLCGYTTEGWELGYDNKMAVSIVIDGQVHTQSHTPQFDHTVGRFPGHFFYGKSKTVSKAVLTSPRFSVYGQSCVRFSYYLRGEIDFGLSVDRYEYYSSGDSTVRRGWFSGLYHNSEDIWRTGYFDLTLGNYQLKFLASDQLKVAVDDVMLLKGMCSNVLCDSSKEFRCNGSREDLCIPKQSRCNVAIDCYDGDDERTCTGGAHGYSCTFENGLLCALNQKVGDYSDWWLVSAKFVGAERKDSSFVDHTLNSDAGHVFYINTYGMQASSSIYMEQRFDVHSYQYCLSFYYQLQSDVKFSIHIECDDCLTQTFVAQSTFVGWTLFQINLPITDIILVTYDVEGAAKEDNFTFPFLAIDDIAVTSGPCPLYTCPSGWMKCRTLDRCVPSSAICNRKVDCLDESDEEQCTCNNQEFRCNSGRCLDEIYVCDRQPQCLDKSDEGNVCDSRKQVTCTFEHVYMCGYESLTTSKYAWHRWQADTPTPVTGPEFDHTKGDRTGYYMYAEANDGDVGDVATLISPPFFSGVGRSLEFWYHHFSSNVDNYQPGVLQLILENTVTQEQTNGWMSNLDIMDKWRRVCIDLPAQVTLRALFKATRNESSIYGTDGVDIAIDDVKQNLGSCADAELTTPASPISSTTKTTTQGTGCNSKEWRCSDGHCIDKSWRCDGSPDCRDGGDEMNCL